MLPEGVDRSSYRERYRKSYPFQPDVIDVLYRKWGSYPEFERTRGVFKASFAGHICGAGIKKAFYHSVQRQILLYKPAEFESHPLEQNGMYKRE